MKSSILNVRKTGLGLTKELKQLLPSILYFQIMGLFFPGIWIQCFKIPETCLNKPVDICMKVKRWSLMQDLSADESRAAACITRRRQH